MTSSDLATMAWTQIWQVTVLIVFVGAVVRGGARRCPHLVFALWLVVLAKCLTPPVMTSPGGIFCWVQPLRRQVTEDSVSSPARALLFNPIAENAIPNARPAKTVEASEWANAAGSSRDFRVPPDVEQRALDNSPATFGAALPPYRRIALRWAGGVWLIGSGLIIGIAVVRWRSCLRQVRESRVESRPDLDSLLAELSHRLKIRRRIRLIVTASRFGPAVVGLFRPAILLPAVVVGGKSPRELEPILAHELIHVRRGDLWISLWQLVAQAVWWFHPFVWLANRSATRAAEACCDDAVIAELGCNGENYARNLLDILEQRRGLVSLPAFPGVRPVDVTRQRLERIMELGQGCRTRTPWWCWLVMAAATAGTLPGGSFLASANEEDEPQSAREQKSEIASEVARRIKNEPRVAAGATEPAGLPRVSLRVTLHADDITQKVDQELLVEADELVAPAKPGENAEDTHRVIEVRKNVRLTLHDGSVRAAASRAVINVHYRRGSNTNAERLDIAISGGGRWNSSGITASANELFVSLRPATFGSAATPRLIDLRLKGEAQLDADDFGGKADNIDVSYHKPDNDAQAMPSGLPAVPIATTIQPSRKATRVLLTGDARLWHSTIPGEERLNVQGERIEFNPSRRALKTKSRKDVNEGSEHELETKTYPVADLLIPVGNLQVAMSPEAKITATNDRDQVAKPVARPSDDPLAQSNFTGLMDLISSTVAPDSWEVQGGPGSMMPYRTTLSLVIRQTESVHDEIADLFGQLRRLQDLQVALKAEIISLEGESSRLPLKLEKDPRDSEERAVYLSDEQAKTFRGSLGKLTDAALTDISRLTFANGQGAELKLRRRVAGKTATVPLPTLQFQTVIAADSSHMRLTLVAGATKLLDALAGNRTFIIRKGQAALIEITDELDANRLPGLVAAQAAVIRRQHRPPRGERVLLLITPHFPEYEEELLGRDFPTQP